MAATSSSVSISGILSSSAKLPLTHKSTSFPLTAAGFSFYPLSSVFFCNSFMQLTCSGVSRRTAMASWALFNLLKQQNGHAFGAVLQGESRKRFKEFIDVFDGYSFEYPERWIQVKGSGADIFFRDPFVLDENLSVELSSPSSSKYTTVGDLGDPRAAAEKVLRQYLTEFMSTRLGVRRQSSVLSTSSRIAEDGRLYYQIEVNIKSFASNNELAVMPQDRVPSLEWDRRYLCVLGVENNRLYELRLQAPEKVFGEEEKDLRRVMESFRVLNSAVSSSLV